MAIKFFRMSHLENSFLDVGVPKVSSKSGLITLTLSITVFPETGINICRVLQVDYVLRPVSFLIYTGNLS